MQLLLAYCNGREQELQRNWRKAQESYIFHRIWQCLDCKRSYKISSYASCWTRKLTKTSSISRYNLQAAWLPWLYHSSSTKVTKKLDLPKIATGNNNFIQWAPRSSKVAMQANVGQNFSRTKKSSREEATVGYKLATRWASSVIIDQRVIKKFWDETQAILSTDLWSNVPAISVHLVQQFVVQCEI